MHSEKGERNGLRGLCDEHLDQNVFGDIFVPDESAVHVRIDDQVVECLAMALDEELALSEKLLTIVMVSDDGRRSVIRRAVWRSDSVAESGVCTIKMAIAWTVNMQLVAEAACDRDEEPGDELVQLRFKGRLVQGGKLAWRDSVAVNRDGEDDVWAVKSCEDSLEERPDVGRSIAAVCVGPDAMIEDDGRILCSRFLRFFSSSSEAVAGVYVVGHNHTGLSVCIR